MSDPAKSLWYVAHVSTSGRQSLRWSRPYDRIGEAVREAKRLVADPADTAIWTVVVKFAGGRKTPILSTVQPTAARTAAEHWEAVWAATE